MIPVHISVRGVIIVSIIIFGIGIFVIVSNSQEKTAYNKVTGSIEYFEKEYQKLPIRHKGDFRYLKVSTYPYMFEIYAPNSMPTEKTIDDLSVGDSIDIYYYEISDTKNEGINRFTQFIDKDGQPYFIRNGFQKQLGYILIGLCVLMNVMASIFWKKGKLEW